MFHIAKLNNKLYIYSDKLTDKPVIFIKKKPQNTLWSGETYNQALAAELYFTKKDEKQSQKQSQ